MVRTRSQKKQSVEDEELVELDEEDEDYEEVDDGEEDDDVQENEDNDDDENENDDQGDGISLEVKNLELYKVLGVEKTASAGEIKRAYYQKAKECHPDLHPDDKEANSKFQRVGAAYEVLQDPEKRALYDKTGQVDNSFFTSKGKGFDWDGYWRALYKKVTVDDIEQFAKQYKGSEEETKDLKEAYMKCKGDLTKVLEEVMLATYDDVERFRKILKKCIERKEVPYFDAIDKKQKKSKKLQQEELEADKLMKEIQSKKKGESKALTVGQQRMSSMLSMLQQKYGGTESNEISEEEFQKTRSRMESSNSSSDSSKRGTKRKRN